MSSDEDSKKRYVLVDDWLIAQSLISPYPIQLGLTPGSYTEVPKTGEDNLHANRICFSSENSSCAK
jgi:hypothetical protein